MKNSQGRLSSFKLLRQFSNYLPQFCCFCHQKTTSGRDLCIYCEQQFPQLTIKSVQNPSTLCLRCGKLWPQKTELQYCASCAKYQSGIRRVIAPCRYEFPIDYLIGRLKYQQHLQSGRLLGSLLAQTVYEKSVSSKDLPDFLLPVPLSRERYLNRGFNHADEIAHACGSILGIPVLANKAGRHFDTGALAGLSKAERSLRIRGAFWVDESVRSCRVAIIDDVLTSGATTGELATELSDSGVDDIQVWVVARTAAAS